MEKINQLNFAVFGGALFCSSALCVAVFSTSCVMWEEEERERNCDRIIRGLLSACKCTSSVCLWLNSQHRNARIHRTTPHDANSIWPTYSLCLQMDYFASHSAKLVSFVSRSMEHTLSATHSQPSLFFSVLFAIRLWLSSFRSDFALVIHNQWVDSSRFTSRLTDRLSQCSF